MLLFVYMCGTQYAYRLVYIRTSFYLFIYLKCRNHAQMKAKSKILMYHVPVSKFKALSNAALGFFCKLSPNLLKICQHSFGEQLYQFSCT
jgi:hypothetical protein